LPGYAERELSASHDRDANVRITLEIDPAGNGTWHAWRRLEIEPGETARHLFPPAFEAYWLRAVADADCRATVQLTYR